MSLQALAISVEVHAAAWALLHFTWQGSFIAALLWLVLAAVPRQRAALRYAAGCSALALQALSPPLTAWYLLAQHAPAGPSPLVDVGAGAVQGSAVSLWLLVGWALGSGVMTLRLVLGLATLRTLVANATPAPAHWQWQVVRLARRARLLQHVRLLISQDVDAPVVLGWLRPVMLLPLSALTSLPIPYVEALLAHELGHVRRLDYLVNLAQSVVEALLFYHPAVHWVSRCIRAEREHCCDDIAIRVTGEPLGYVRALTEMEALRARPPEPALAANGGTLLLRIERILKLPASTQRKPRVLLTASVLTSALGLALVGAWACSSSTESALASGPAAPLELAELGFGAAPRIPVRWLPSSLAPHEAPLVEAAERHGLDPALLAIVTLVESLGDPRAQSPGGARGLMQLMPSTAASIARVRELTGYTEERLWDPEYNLDLGAWYLSQQLAEFGAGSTNAPSVELAAVAYNCGPRCARSYLEGAVTLPQETVRYRDLISGMWNERLQPESPTFNAWQHGHEAAADAVQP